MACFRLSATTTARSFLNTTLWQSEGAVGGREVPLGRGFKPHFLYETLPASRRATNPLGLLGNRVTATSLWTLGEPGLSWPTTSTSFAEARCLREMIRPSRFVLLTLSFSLSAAVDPPLLPREARHSFFHQGEFFLRLCHEGHRELVASFIRSRHASADRFSAVVTRHIRNLEALPALFLRKVSAAAVTEIKRVKGVCELRPVSILSAHSPSLEEYVAPNNGTWWHLDRINQALLPLDGDGSRNLTGVGVNIFVLDTGLDTTLEEFNNDNREVLNVASVIEGEEFRYWPRVGWSEPPQDVSLLINNDVYGHGTHTTGMCGGRTLGVAPGVNLYHIKVLADNGYGSTEGVVTAFDDVAEIVSSGALTGSTIVSVSLGGECWHGDPEYCQHSAPESRAIESLSALGVAVVVSAGNEADDACFYTPAAASSAVTVGASDYTDVVAWWSSYGSCVDIVGPGVDVALPQTSNDVHSEYYFEQDYIDDEAKQIAISSGTSFSAPAVSGTLALYAELLNGRDGSANMTNAINALINRATTNVLYQAPDLCPTNDRFVRTPGTLNPLALNTTPPADTGCPDPPVRLDWPLFVFHPDDPLSFSYSYDFACFQECDNCTDILDTYCDGTCAPLEASYIYDLACDEDDDEIFLSYSYSYSYEEEATRALRIQVPRETVKGQRLESGMCDGIELYADPGYRFDSFAFAATAGSYVSYSEVHEDIFSGEGGCGSGFNPCSGSSNVTNEDGLLVVYDDDYDPTQTSVICRVCNEASSTITVDYSFYSVYSSEFNDRNIFQDTSALLSVNETVDFLATRSGHLQVAGECRMSVRDEVWRKSGSAIDPTKRSYYIPKGTYFAITATKSVYPKVQHVRCTVILHANDTDRLATEPTYFPSTISVSSLVPSGVVSNVPTPVPTLASTGDTSTPSMIPVSIPTLTTSTPAMQPTSFIMSTPTTPLSLPTTSAVSSPNSPTDLLSAMPTFAPTPGVIALVSSKFSVSGLALKDATSNTDVFDVALANLFDVQEGQVSTKPRLPYSDGSRRLDTGVTIYVDYTVSVLQQEADRIVNIIVHEVTPEILDGYIQQAAKSRNKQALFAEVKTLSVDSDVDVKYGYDSTTTAPARYTATDRESSSKSLSTGAVLGIAFAALVGFLVVSGGAYTVHQRRQQKRYFLTRETELLDPDPYDGSVEMT